MQEKTVLIQKLRADLADARRREPALTAKIAEQRAALQAGAVKVESLQAELLQAKQVAAANRDTITRLRSRNESALVSLRQSCCCAKSVSLTMSGVACCGQVQW
jgi:hypothetical protein